MEPDAFGFSDERELGSGVVKGRAEYDNCAGPSYERWPVCLPEAGDKISPRAIPRAFPLRTFPFRRVSTIYVFQTRGHTRLGPRHPRGKIGRRNPHGAGGFDRLTFRLIASRHMARRGISRAPDELLDHIIRRERRRCVENAKSHVRRRPLHNQFIATSVKYQSHPRLLRVVDRAQSLRQLCPGRISISLHESPKFRPRMQQISSVNEKMFLKRHAMTWPIPGSGSIQESWKTHSFI